MNTVKVKPIQIIGRVEKTSLPTLGILQVPARIDTGAKTSSIWASDIKLNHKGELSFYIFGKSSPYYNGTKIVTKSINRTVIASSIGATEVRFKVRLLIKLNGRKIRATFTLADRSKQVYPILIGRNVLRGKFIVDVKQGKVLKLAEKHRTSQLMKSIR